MSKIPEDADTCTTATACDYCRRPFQMERVTTKRGGEVRWMNGPNVVHGAFKHPITGADCKKVALCDSCLDDEVMGHGIRSCPKCEAFVDQGYIESAGACPVCGFVEDECEGSSWI